MQANSVSGKFAKLVQNRWLAKAMAAKLVEKS